MRNFVFFILVLIFVQACDKPKTSSSSSTADTPESKQEIIYPCPAAKPLATKPAVKVELVAAGKTKLLQGMDYSKRNFTGVIFSVTALVPNSNFFITPVTVCGITETGKCINPILIRPIKVKDAKFTIALPPISTHEIPKSSEAQGMMRSENLYGLVQAIGSESEKMWDWYPTIANNAKISYPSQNTTVVKDAYFGTELSIGGNAKIGLLFETASSQLTTIYVLGEKMNIPK